MGCVTRFQCLRGTTAQRNSFTPLAGELVFDTSLNIMFVGDGSTVGGIPFSGSQPFIVNIFTSSTGITGNDYAIANSGSPITFTLPDAATYNKKIGVKNAGAGLLTIAPVLGQLIDGLTDVQLLTTNAIELVPKSGGWYIW